MTVEPFAAAEVHVRVTCASAVVGDDTTTAPGSENGVAVPDAVAAPEPAELLALTRNEYDVPFVSDVIVAEVPVTVVVVAHVRPPSDDCSTAYPVSVVPPVSVGADHDSATCVDDGVAPSDNGAEA